MNTPQSLECPVTNARCTKPECARPKCLLQLYTEFKTRQLEERGAVGRKLNKFLKGKLRANLTPL